MTEKRYKLSEPNGAYLIDNDRPCAHWIDDDDKIIDLLNDLVEENEQLKVRFKEERELAMRLSRECDTLTITKQELELEIERLEAIIKTGKK